MFAKIVVLIVSFGLLGCMLLSARQERLQVVREMTELQKDIADLDRKLWLLRVEIGRSVDLDRIRQHAKQYGDFVPVLNDLLAGLGGGGDELPPFFGVVPTMIGQVDTGVPPEQTDQPSTPPGPVE